MSYTKSAPEDMVVDLPPPSTHDDKQGVSYYRRVYHAWVGSTILQRIMCDFLDLCTGGTLLRILHCTRYVESREDLEP
jgi:hypothetical protein